MHQNWFSPNNYRYSYIERYNSEKYLIKHQKSFINTFQLDFHLKITLFLEENLMGMQLFNVNIVTEDPLQHTATPGLDA